MQTAYSLVTEALDVLIRRAQLMEANRCNQAGDSKLNRSVVVLEDAQICVSTSSESAANDQEDGKEAGHGLSLDRCVHARHELGQMLLGESRKNTIGNAVGQSFGPLGHSRGGNADCLGCGCDRASEKFNGF
jgi:dihydropteroate synthase